MPQHDVILFRDGEISRDELMRRHQDCACENTPRYDEGFGRVDDGEEIGFFVVSPRHCDIRKESGDPRLWAPKPKDLRRATRDGGLSVYRVQVAQTSELRQAAKKARGGQEFISDQSIVGVVAWHSITTVAVRSIRGEKGDRLCVIDTPGRADPEEGLCAEPSHADIAWSLSSNGVGEDEFRERRQAIEERMKSAFARHGKVVQITDFTAADVTDYLPDRMKDT